MYTYMYMGKNYTLYINQTQFETESNKSGLINKLLLKYYSGAIIEVEKSTDGTKLPASTKKKNICPIHGIDKDLCKLMKHK
jgi:hypothetical protein